MKPEDNFDGLLDDWLDQDQDPEIHALCWPVLVGAIVLLTLLGLSVSCVVWRALT